MTAIAILNHGETCIVGTDSLATDESGASHRFTSKAFYLPHTKTLISGTGAGDFVPYWMMFVVSRVHSENVEELNPETQLCLPRVWKGYAEETKLSDSFKTVSIFHTGYSAERGAFVTYKYSSKNNFAVQVITEACFTQPDAGVDGNNIVEVIAEQRRQQDEKIGNGGIIIGGEVHIYCLDKDGCSIVDSNRFSDFEEDKEAIDSRPAFSSCDM